MCVGGFVGRITLRSKLGGFASIGKMYPSGWDWEAFWRSVRPRFQSNKYFSAYIPPHRNTTAILIRAWYAWLEQQ